MRTFLLRLLHLIGNSLLYGSIFALITGSIAYAATGTKMLPNFLSSGVDFMSFFSNSGDGTAGIDARSYYTRVNGSWMGYPGDNRNYLRGGTFLSGSIYDEDDSAYYLNPNGTSQFNTMSGKTICLNGDCRTGWSSESGSGLKGIFLPHAGKSISCVNGFARGDARVLSDGTVQVGCGYSWINGSTTTCGSALSVTVDSVNLYVVTTDSFAEFVPNTRVCSATWP